MKQISYFRFLLYKVCSTCLIVSMFGSCKSDRPVDGFDLLLNPDDLGNVESTRSPATYELSYQDTAAIAETGSQLLLSLGAFDDTETLILLRFDSVPDSVEITKATLLLFTSSLIASGRSKSVFTARVRKVQSAWDETTVTFEDFNFNNMEEIASAEIKSKVADVAAGDSISTETTRFEFNAAGLAAVRNWADSTSADTNGVLIDFDNNSDFIKEFFSRHASLNKPLLELHVAENGIVVDTLFSLATADAFLFNRRKQLPTGPLYVDNLFGNKTLIKFNLDSIPRESTINRADLFLHVDQKNSILKSTGYPLQINRVVEFDSLNQIIVADSILTPIFRVVNGDSLKVSILSILQFWVTKDFENHGLLLRATTPGFDISRIAFHSLAAIPALRPRIEVVFSTAPKTP